ncbi:MAG: phosphate propanoyltransferase [Oscillospiraceae bacterium]|nr:phosphate propanoyltransferase [Oscillospiraceae bacterium]
MNEQQIKEIVASVLAGLVQDQASQAGVLAGIPIEASARHVHLNAQSFAALFGAGELKQVRALSQPGEFLSEQRVSIATPKGMLENIAVLGPLRKATQVELSLSDCRQLGLDAPLRLSGDLADAAEVTLIGPAGVFQAKNSTIVAKNHVHMNPNDAATFCVKDGDLVSVRAQTARPVVFEQVPVRVRENFTLAMHIDFDEANACMLHTQRAVQQAAPEHVIAEKVITETRAKQLCERGGQVLLHKGTIITPSARDMFSQYKCEVIFK